MTTFQIILAVFIGIVGMLPDNLFNRKSNIEKTRKRGHWIRIVIISLSAIAILINSIVEKREKEKSVDLEILQNKSTSLLTKISVKLSEESSDYQTYESMLSIIKSTNSILSMTEKGTDEYNDEIKELEDAKQKLEHVSNKIKLKECYSQTHLLIDSFFIINSDANKDVVLSNYEKFHKLLDESYDKNYLITSRLITDIYIQLNDIHNTNFNKQLKGEK